MGRRRLMPLGLLANYSAVLRGGDLEQQLDAYRGAARVVEYTGDQDRGRGAAQHHQAERAARDATPMATPPSRWTDTAWIFRGSGSSMTPSVTAAARARSLTASLSPALQMSASSDSGVALYA